MGLSPYSTIGRHIIFQGWLWHKPDGLPQLGYIKNAITAASTGSIILSFRALTPDSQTVIGRFIKKRA